MRFGFYAALMVAMVMFAVASIMLSSLTVANNISYSFDTAVYKMKPKPKGRHRRY